MNRRTLLFTGTMAFLSAAATLAYKRKRVETKTITVPDWQKPYAIAISPDGLTAEVLAWRGQEGLHRYTWKYPDTTLTHAGKVSAGYAAGTGGREQQPTVTKELEGRVAAMRKNLGVNPEVEEQRATLLADWQAKYPPPGRNYRGRAISADGNVVVGVVGGGIEDCFRWRHGQGFTDLNQAYGLTWHQFGYQSYMALTPDGTTLWWADETAVLWSRDASDLAHINSSVLRLAGTIKSMGSGQLVVSVTSVTPPGRNETPLSPPRNKVVLLPKGFTTPDGVRVGARVIVSGEDSGAGKPLTAQSVTLAGGS